EQRSFGQVRSAFGSVFRIVASDRENLAGVNCRQKLDRVHLMSSGGANRGTRGPLREQRVQLLKRGRTAFNHAESAVDFEQPISRTTAGALDCAGQFGDIANHVANQNAESLTV